MGISIEKLENRKYTIYCHVFPNGKKYIGQTCVKLAKRWGKNGRKYEIQPYLYNAILKYGWDNIDHVILRKNLNYKEVDFYEKFYINLYETNKPEFGYNIETGGSFHKEICLSTREKLRVANLGKKLSKETCEKMSKSRTGKNNPNYGVKYSDERKKQMSLVRMGKPSANKGKKLSEEIRKQMSIDRKGRKSNAIWTDEMRINMSIKQKSIYTEERRKHSSEIKKGGKNPMSKICIVIDLQTKEKYKFDCCKDVMDFIKFGHTTFTNYVNSNKPYKNKYIIKAYKRGEEIKDDIN